MNSERSGESKKERIRLRLSRMTGQQWLVLLLLGLLLAVMALPVSHEKKDTEEFSLTLSDQEEPVQSSELERKLESLLSRVEGVGEVQVMLMTGQDTKKDSFYSSENTRITGVLVAAEGADSPVTVQNIQQAVMALFQVEAHKIKIMKMK